MPQLKIWDGSSWGYVSKGKKGDTGSMYIDQSGGTSDTYGVLSGTLNSSNKTFTVSQGIYSTGSLMVYLNGQLQTQGTAQDWVETTPASGVFDFITAPDAGDEITVTYAISAGGVIGAIPSALKVYMNSNFK